MVLCEIMKPDGNENESGHSANGPNTLSNNFRKVPYEDQVREDKSPVLIKCNYANKWRRVNLFQVDETPVFNTTQYSQ